MLKFSEANAKIHALAKVPNLQKYLDNDRKIYSFDLLSGWSCPFAKDCLSKVKIDDQNKRYLEDGKDTKFRCFSASQEVLFTNTYNLRSNNFNGIKNSDNIVQAISSAMPKNLGICRIHVGGDFFNEEYFLAWAEVAKNNPTKLFYAYTKSLPYWVNNRKNIKKIDNFVLTASRGGRHDRLIGIHKLRYSEVVFSTEQADKLGLQIDHDDSHAADKNHRKFALLIHGPQPAGSEASKAKQALNGLGSYNRKNKKIILDKSN